MKRKLREVLLSTLTWLFWAKRIWRRSGRWICRLIVVALLLSGELTWVELVLAILIATAM